jgi:hypothetical protein
MKARVLAALAGALAVAGVWHLREVPSRSSPGGLAAARSPVPASVGAMATTVARFPAPLSPSALSPRRALASEAEARDAWRAFQSRQGADLQAKFGESGCLESVRGTGRAQPGFDARDLDQAVGRARALLAELGALLCLDPASAFERPRSKGTAASTQVSFHQTYAGLEVLPNGRLSFDLGPAGEVFSIYADPVRVERVTNVRALTSEQAQGRTLAALDAVREAKRIEEGGPVIWVAPPDALGHSLARHAYRYAAGGHEVVTDAETGAVLSVRDRRQF